MRVLWIFVIILMLQRTSASYYHHTHKRTRSCIVPLATGRIRGNCSHPVYDAFTNVPYAKAPIGNLRLESPRPISKWEGMRRASETPRLCVQFYEMFQEMQGTEDCLNVHIYVPKHHRQPRKLRRHLNVIIWLHPGGFQIGTSVIEPKLFMSDGTTLIVGVSYRVGPLGFLSTNDMSLPGNLGLKDQRLAIKWVERNIAAFGGDPNKIVLLGSSAGSVSTQLHLITGSSSKIKAYVSLGGSVLSPWGFTRKPKLPAKEFAEAIKCPYEPHTEKFKNCLKLRSIQDIWYYARGMQKFQGFSLALFRPTIEPAYVADAFITTEPEELIKAGYYSEKPYLIGTTKGMGVFGAALLTQRNAVGNDAIEPLNTRWYELCPLMFFLSEDKTPVEQRNICERLKQQYMCNKSFNLHTYKLLEHMFSDIYFNEGIEKSVQLHRNAGQKVYRVVTDLPLRYNLGNFLAVNRNDLCFGSVLSNDVVHIMGLNLGLPEERLSQDQSATFKALIDLIKSMLTKQPTFKRLELSANIDDNNSSRCLYVTYGQEAIRKCKLDEVHCQRFESILC